jgi:DNA (cytosine-5)-methyltransferase 1
MSRLTRAREARGGRPLLLDLFCGAGGAAMGYHRAGFDVLGVDIEPQPNYPFGFIQADALEALDELEHSGCWLVPPDQRAARRCVDEDELAAVHASPVCKDHSKLRRATKRDDGTAWLLGATRERLEAQPLPWVIENVAGAAMRPDFKLCGCMFGLADTSGRHLYRERWFETSWHAFDLRPPCHHSGRAITVAGHGAQGGWEYVDGVAPTQADRRQAMGIDWMNRNELAQAIPPVFAEFVGHALLEHLAERAA